MVSPTRTVPYAQRTQQELSLHLFEPQGTGPHPAIVLFFGGGWIGGTPSQFYPQAQHLADQGMIAICAEYRVRDRHGTSPFDCVADGKTAMRYVRSHAAELGIDPTRIAAGGGSAGAHVAAASSLVPGLDHEDDDLSVSPRADCLILFNPVLDQNPDDGYGHDRLGKRWREISPAHHVTPSCPPCCVLVGDSDKLIPVAVMERFRAAIADTGGHCDLHIYGQQAHGFFNWSDGNNPCHAQTLAVMTSFLAAQGFNDR
ncbi:MAG: alpha/beta hydrolase [Planctomycetota bacterium]|jgi:acetyl esterase|nr:alpha/beta hydrolase [Planctomycetota bacterium]